MAIKIDFSNARKVVFLVFLLVFTFSSGYFFGVKGYRAEVDKALKVSVSREVPPEKNINFDLFWNVWDTLSSTYYDKSKLMPSAV
jgi:hypothetical protein